MTAPAIKAGIVKTPIIRPIPTNNSPQGTKTLKRSIFGKAKFCKKAAYHPCTAGCPPPVFASAP